MELKKTRKRKGQTSTKRTPEAQEVDKSFCVALYLRGYSYRQISELLAEEVKRRGDNYTISKAQIHRDITACLIEWKRERLENIEHYMTAELLKLDAIERELWTAWDKSKKGTEGETPGNGKYIDLLLGVQQRRAKMLGLDAPEKHLIESHKTEGNAPKYNIKALPEQLVYELADSLQDAEQKRVEDIDAEEVMTHGEEDSTE